MVILIKPAITLIVQKIEVKMKELNWVEQLKLKSEVFQNDILK